MHSFRALNTCVLVFSSFSQCVMCLTAQSCPTLCNPMYYSPPGSSVHWDSSGKDTGVCCHALLQGNFPSQGLNAGLPLCRCILYHLSHQGSPPVYIVRLNWHITLCKFKVYSVMVWWFDMCIYYEMIVIRRLVNTSITSYSCFFLFLFLLLTTFKIYSVSSI